MDSFIRIAKEIKKRDNEYHIGVCVGEVVSHTPVTIRIYCKGEPLEFEDFFNFEGLINGGADMTTGDLYVAEYPVEIGDKFICMTGNDNQSLYVLGKLENIKNLNIYLL